MNRITNKEIEYAEKILLPKNKSFFPAEKEKTNERVEIIRCLESRDIEACPGSGKTTVLLAKLLILASRMPFKDNKGICVLTHTNVAIDEIKYKLGLKSNILFKHPNHFGTFQSFVDKFLAIPAFIYLFKQKVKIIDTDIYNDILIKYIPTILRNNKWLINKREWEMKLCRWRIIFSKGKNISLVTDIINKAPIFSSKNNTCRQIIDYKLKIMKDYATLSFDDAYSIAFYYIESHPEIINYFSSRFKYVFIDEMQDTQKHQIELIDRLFKNTEVIIQRYGDPNQSIFDKYTESNDQFWVTKNPLRISDSKRFGHKIASTIKSICPKEIATLTGNNQVLSLQPCIILFDDNSIDKVKDIFVNLIYENNLHKINKNIFKAVGWVGDHDSNYSIKSYFPPFNKNTTKKKIIYSNLFSFIYHLFKIDTLSINEFYVIFINILLKLIDELNIKIRNRFFTRSVLIDFLRKRYEKQYLYLRLKIWLWIKKIKTRSISPGELYNEVKYFFNDIILNIWNNINFNNATHFLENKEIEQNNKELEKNNIYRKKINNDIAIKIEFATIHSVKGETHTATLYLETFYKKHDSERIKSFICGDYNNEKSTKKETKMNLKLAYVGMSRPSHLLCLAVHKDRMGCLQCQRLDNCNWKIIDELCKK